MIKFLNVMGNIAQTVIDYGVIWIADIAFIVVFARRGASWKSYAVLAAASALGCTLWRFISEKTESSREKAVNKLCDKIFGD